MNKLKIILFGASDNLIKSALETLKLKTCEIIALCDNDKYKQGLKWNNLPIISINHIHELEFDFIVINALYSYHIIYKNLVMVGIQSNKIIPLLSLTKIMFLTDKVNTFPKDVLSKLFQDDPEKINDRIIKLNEIVQKYSEIQPINTKDNDINLNDYPLIAHAGGGYIQDKQEMYSDSLEAFLTSIKAGFKMFEFDICGLIEDDIIFVHDAGRFRKLYFYNDYTPLRFTKMLTILSNNPELKVMLDIKWNTLLDYTRILEKMESILTENYIDKYNEFKKQIFVQTYNKETIQSAVQHGWKCFLTSYRNPEGNWIQKSACLCCEFGITGIMLDVGSALHHFKYLKFLKEKNIPIIVYSTDSLDEYVRLKSIGITCVLTNFMKPYENEF